MSLKRFSRGSYKRGKARNIRGYNILEEYSSPDRVAYQSISDPKKVIYSFTGTRLEGSGKSWKSMHNATRDVTTDALLVLGLKGSSSRIKNAVHHTKKLLDQGYEVTAVGHSLGGSTAMEVSRQLGIPAEVHNPYISSDMLRENYSNVKVYHTKGDWISEHSKHVRSKKTYIEKKVPHRSAHDLVPDVM